MSTTLPAASLGDHGAGTGSWRCWRQSSMGASTDARSDEPARGGASRRVIVAFDRARGAAQREVAGAVSTANARCSASGGRTRPREQVASASHWACRSRRSRASSRRSGFSPGRLGLEPAQRYQRERPGELIHIDVKKLGRIQGGAGKRARASSRNHYTLRLTDAAGRRRGTAGWESRLMPAFPAAAGGDHQPGRECGGPAPVSRRCGARGRTPACRLRSCSRRTGLGVWCPRAGRCCSGRGSSRGCGWRRTP